MVHLGEFLKIWSLQSNSVTRQVKFNRTKIGGKCQNWKIQMRHFEQISNNVECKEMEYFHMFLPKFPFHLHRSPASFDR